MTELAASVSVRSYLRSGAIAGALSAISFAFIHALVISNIWSSIAFMMGAGALCGLCLAWSYAVVVTRPSIGSWIRYNALFVALLAILGLISVLLFEPVTTITALLQQDGPPTDLFKQALPLTAAFTITMAIILSLLYRRDWQGFGAALLATTVLVMLLGLNVSIMGLVDIPRSFFYLIPELFGLIFALGSVYTALFAALERKNLIHTTRT